MPYLIKGQMGTLCDFDSIYTHFDIKAYTFLIQQCKTLTLLQGNCLNEKYAVNYFFFLPFEISLVSFGNLLTIVEKVNH